MEALCWVQKHSDDLSNLVTVGYFALQVVNQKSKRV